MTPQVAFVKVVNDELIALMGEAGARDLEPGRPQVVLMAGLQVRSPAGGGAGRAGGAAWVGAAQWMTEDP